MKTLLLIAVLVGQQAAPSVTGTVSGTVLYSDGTPPSLGMMVRLTPVGQTAPASAPTPYTFTNAAGVYTLRAPEGRYFIHTSSANPTYYPGVLNQNNATPVSITAGTVNSGLNFSLPLSVSGVRVQGRVVLPANYPVPATQLQVWLSRQPIRLSADGTFEFTHVLPGAYSLTGWAPGSQPIPLTVSDRDITGIELVAPGLIRVQGTVTLEGTGARPRLSLMIEGLVAPGMTPENMLSGPVRDSVTSGLDGSFSINLPAGEYRLSVTNLAAGYYVKSIASGDTEITGTPLKVASSNASIKLAITVGMSPGVRVSGRVTRANDDNTSTPPEKIILAGMAVAYGSEASLSPDGSFEIPKILPGKYFARVSLSPTVTSAPAALVIPNRNLTDLEIPVPAPRKISGKIAVDGNGPPPKLPLLLVRGMNTLLEGGTPGEASPLLSASLINTVLGGGKPGVQILQLDINALPDGSFTMEVPDGEYRVVVMTSAPQMNLNSIPPAYFLRSLTSNSADLLKEPLIISEKETPEIHIGLGTTAPNPWVKVSGRVKGMDSARSSMRVALESSITSRIETFVDSEGKFEFPAVLQNTRYTARLLPTDDAASTPRINVADKDMADVEIVVPPKREITARIVVEGNYPVPSVGLSLNAPDSSMTVVIRPDSDGSALVKLPEDERTVRQLSGLPLGYAIKSMVYGSMDLLKQPLRLGQSAASELKINLSVDPAIPWGSLRGKVSGIDLEKGAVRLVLNGVTAYARFESTLNGDGSFNVARLPQGTYIPTLEGEVVSASLLPGSIVVSGTELAGIEIVAAATNPQRPRVEEPPKGATLSDFPGNSRSSANESAAIANLRTINTALVTFLSASGGRYGSLRDLVEAGILDNSFNSTKSGFNYSLIAIGKDYAAAAIPANSATGRYGFYSIPDAVIRYSTFESLAPPQQSGRPVQ